MNFLIRGLCEMTSVLKVMKLISELIKIVSFIIPMILIIMVSIDLGKAVMAHDENEMKKARAIVVRRIIMGICIFLVPTVVKIGMSLVEGASTSVLQNYNTCIDNMDNIGFYEELEKVLREQEDELAKQRLLEYQNSIKKNVANYTLKAYNSSFESPDNVGVDGVVHGQTYKLTSAQLSKLAGICQREQGNSVAGAAAEASLMANLFELKGKKFSSVYDYVTRSGWFGRTSNAPKPSKKVLAAVKLVLEGGNRTLPLYVDEHDCWNCNKKKYCSGGFKGDICSLQINGKKNTSLSGIKNRNNYVKDKTVIKNVYGATYTFYTFPTSSSDPFGYTAASYKKIKG